MAAKSNKEHNISPSELLEGRSRFFEGDRTLWIIFAVLIVISILVVYSSTAKMAYDITSDLSTADSLRQQIMLVVIATIIVVVFHKINYTVIRFLTPAAFYFFVALTVATYFIGSTTNGAARWIPIGPFQFQPSEALKVFTILMLARRMETRQHDIDKINILPTSWRINDPKQKRILKENTLPLIGPIILACGVILPAHTSSAVIIFAASVLMLFIGRVSMREIIKFLVVTSAVGVLGITAMAVADVGRGDTAGGRFSQWANTWISDGRHNAVYEFSDTERAMIAIHEGGLFGKGAGHSASRAAIIHPESDYAYSFFTSEYGLVAAIILMLLYLWITFRAIEICKRCTKAFPTLITAGLGLLITCQALLHILVQVNILPETGQNLPLISRGGSSLIITAFAFALILGVSRTNDLRDSKQPTKATTTENE
ncbi:MAG: FtsW/RodA/SpoVE family cell cycle protein [Alistipes sp.]|nr:FtsW/RodA/SpoVE family cell cycle protein [Alistipes sp.]